MPPSRSRILALTTLTVAGALSATGALTGVGSAVPATGAPAPRSVAATVATTCAFAAPIGPQPVSVATTAILPTSATAGQQTGIDGFTVDLTLPRATALALLPSGATTGSLQGGLTMDLGLTQGSKKDALPAPLTIAPTPIPASGDVTLVATGTVPRFIADTADVLEFAVTAPKLAIAAVPPPATTDPAPASTAPPAPTPQTSCTLNPDQKTALGSIVVVSPGTPAPGAKSAAVTPKDDPEPPPEPIYSSPLGLIRVVASSRVLRLGAKVVAGPAGLVNGLLTIWSDNTTTVTAGTVLPPAQATFLGFGFVPVTATTEFLPVNYRDGKLIDISGDLNTDTGILTSHMEVMARMSNVRINGVPLDVGPDCVTAKPVAVDVQGPFDPLQGGYLRTDPNNPDPKFRGFTLPPFTGCGAAEPLSPLFTGMASGPDNQVYVDMFALQECHQPDHTTCPQPPPPVTDPPASSTPPAPAARTGHR